MWKRLLQVTLYAFASPFFLAYGLIRALGTARAFRRGLLAPDDTIDCPVGHPNKLYGRWHCQCGATYLGHAFAPCPVCKSVAGLISCSVCSLTIQSAWRD